MADGMIQSGIFESLQKKIDEDGAVKDVSEVKLIHHRVCLLTTANRPFAISCKSSRSKVREAVRLIPCSTDGPLDRTTQAILSRAHSTGPADRV